MHTIFKSRLKKVLIAASVIGILVACFLGMAAWNDNPLEEFHSGGVPTSDFYVLLLATFFGVSGPIFLIGTVVVYVISKLSSKSQ
jgi:Mg/Co/Ni transporter MgtE